MSRPSTRVVARSREKKLIVTAPRRWMPAIKRFVDRCEQRRIVASGRVVLLYRLAVTLPSDLAGVLHDFFHPSTTNGGKARNVRFHTFDGANALVVDGSPEALQPVRELMHVLANGGDRKPPVEFPQR